MGTFSHDVRILICGNCGAPLRVATEGGDTVCDYCRATTRVDPRKERPVAAADAPPMSEAERLEALRAQDGTPLRPPSTLPFSLIGWNGTPNAKKYALAQKTWQASRKRIEAGKPEEHDEDHVYFLTLVFSNYYAKTQELDKFRAVLETSIELCEKPRHRQVLLCTMARQAARSGSVDDADVWLAPCDPRSADIHQDSAWRYARAYVLTRRAKYIEVIELLGARTGDVPIADFYEHSVALYRANAHEKIGDFKLAEQVLQQALDQVPTSPRIFKDIAESNREIDLCPKTWPAVYGPRMFRWRLRWWLYTIVWVGLMSYFVASAFGGEKGDGWSFPVRNVGPAIGTLVIGFIPWMRWRP